MHVVCPPTSMCLVGLTAAQEGPGTGLQAPMHTKSLATLRMGMVRRALRRTAATVQERRAMDAEGEAPGDGGGGGGMEAAAVMAAMSEKSRALGSAAAERLQGGADAHRAAGAAQPGMGCLACRTGYSLMPRAHTGAFAVQAWRLPATTLSQSLISSATLTPTYPWRSLRRD